MLPRNAIEAAQMTLRLVPEILDAIDVIVPVRKQLAVVDPVVPKIQHIERVVAAKRVAVHNAIRHDLVLHDVHQCA